MSYEEKGQWVYLVANVLTYGGIYLIFAVASLTGTTIKLVAYRRGF